MNFNFTYGLGTTLQQMVGMEMAGRIWSSYLKDPVTVNIHVGMVSSLLLPSKVIGGALAGVQSGQKYTDVRDRLLLEAGNLDYTSALSGISDGRSFDDKVSASHLAGDKELTTNLDWQMSTVAGSFGNTDSLKTSRLNVTRANAKALGLTVPNLDNLDGYIVLSDLSGATTSSGQSVSWNYNYTAAPNSNQLDFLSTAVHEIGHVLGFISGVDRPGWMTNTVDIEQEKELIDNAKKQVQNATPLDLFRWSGISRNNISYGTIAGSVLGDARYFSIDNGMTNIADFSTGADTSRGGDGAQASHWKQGLSTIMGPKLKLGHRPQVSAIDLRALDVIGWDLKTTTATSSAPQLSVANWAQSRMVERGGLNAASLANLTIDLSSLQSSVISSLATATGQTTTWINSNLTNASAALSTTLRRDRTLDVETMITDSVVYNWGRNKGDGTWQTMLNLFYSEGLFSSTDELEYSPDVQTATLEMMSNPQTGSWTFGIQAVQSDVRGFEVNWGRSKGDGTWATIVNGAEVGSMGQEIDLGMNFANSVVSEIKSFSLSKQSQLGRGSRAWDSKGKKAVEKVIPESERLEFTHQPQEFTIG
jgi:hypothetical protein